jgi:hypothetical protein
MTAARLDRAQVLSFIDAAAPDTPVVLSLGGIAREMLAVAGRKGNHFVSLDAMGQTISVALGLENSDTTGKILAAPTPSTPASPSSKKGLRPARDAKRNGVDGNVEAAASSARTRISPSWPCWPGVSAVSFAKPITAEPEDR